ncbi:MAG: hypothetical protein ACI32N_10080 [Bulleidia sp.]
MKTWKLVSGILCIVLVTVVMFQSCAVGFANTVEGNEELSGTAGMIVAFLMLSGGIVSVSTSKSNSKGSNIALIILFGLSAFVGFVGSGRYGDLPIWSFWCLINAVMALICLTRKGKKE